MTTSTLVKKTSFTCASLATSILLGICAPAQAFMFGTNGVQFDQDTTVNFTFDRSQGAYQSSLWVAQAQEGNTGYSNISRLFYEFKTSDEGSTNEWEGTFGKSVSAKNGSKEQNFTFLKDEVYALLLWSDSGSGKQFEQYVSSSTLMNSPEWFAAGSKFSKTDCLVGGCQQAVFGDFTLDYKSDKSFTTVNGGKGPEEFSSVTMAQLIQGTNISLDDGGKGNDNDFQDFGVTAQVVPEPISVLGTILGIGALGAARSKKKRHQQQPK